MEKKEVLKIVDHTLLSQTATWEEIRQILDDGIKFEAASDRKSTRLNSSHWS